MDVSMLDATHPTALTTNKYNPLLMKKSSLINKSVHKNTILYIFSSYKFEEEMGLNRTFCSLYNKTGWHLISK